MNRLALVVGGVVAVVALIAALGSMYTVEQREMALVLQFGEPIKVVEEPGLNFKFPFVQDVVYFDKRLLDYDAPAEEMIASDQKRLVVDAFARYRIDNPLLFHQTVRTEAVLRPRLGSIINSNLRKVLGTVPLEAVVSEDRAQLMRTIAANVQREAKALGILVEDVRVKRADLPEANSEAVFRPHADRAAAGSGGTARARRSAGAADSCRGRPRESGDRRRGRKRLADSAW